jgi:hypothetical protein
VKISRLFEMFMKEPFRFSELIARYFSELCTYNNCLPQGAPTSPVISNFMCRKIDARLIKLAKKNDCSYSRYADDITFSSDSKIFVNDIIRSIVSILNDGGFQCNGTKIRYQFRHKRQEVTGITVNEKLNIPRKYIRNLRVILNDWKVNGLEKASERYKKKYSKYLIKGYPLFVNSVRGKIEYVGKVRGKDDDVYHKLLNSFNNLLGKSIDSGKDIQEKVQKMDKKKEYIVKGRYEHNSHLFHDPVELSKALNKFTVEGNFLKKLVHDPNDDKPCLDLELILNESKSELNEIKNKIPYELYNNIEKNLIKKYENDGLRIWKKNNKLHPLSDYDFKSDIKSFKKSYRFGYAGKEETNIYRSLMNIINDKFTEYSPLFKFKNENLISRISCYTDVQQVINGITALISNILKNTEDIEEIHIDIEEDKGDAHSIKTLIINSIGVSSRYDLHNTLNRFKENKGDISALRDKYSKDGHFFTRCDWKIEGFFEKEGYYELSLLDRNRPDLDIIYSKLNFNESKRYFKNKIIFYEFVK